MSLLIENLQHAYADPDGGRTPVLDIDHYELAKGEQAALVGSSGGGKTTLLNVIAGIRSPDAGRVLVDGHDVHALPEPGRDRLRAAKIGFVFQTFNLLPAFTAVENVLLGMSFTGGQADRGRALELLERVGLGHRVNNLPAKLSVGERQRVAVARALVNRPALLLADEPTASVDAANRQKILDLLRDSCREGDVSLLVVTHDEGVASQFGRVDPIAEINRAALAAV